MLPIKHLLEHKYLLVVTVSFQIGVTVLMLLPSSGFPNIQISNFDKLAHVGIYFLSFLLWAFSFFNKAASLKKTIILVLILLLIYGMVIEVVQGQFIPDRTSDIWDIVANSVGLGIGWVVFYILKPIWPAKN